MLRLTKYLLLLAITMLIASCGDDKPVDPDPNGNGEQPIDTTAPYIEKMKDDITELAMNKGYTIIGKRFGTKKGKVYLEDNVEANVVRWRDTAISINIDACLIPGNLYVVSSEGKKSNKFKYTVAPNNAYPVLIPIDGGTFTMGDNSSENNAEKPEHQVTIKPFYISATEITQKQYAEVMLSSLPNFKPKGDDYPANYVRFNDAVRFCNALSKIHKLEECYTIDDPGGDEHHIKVYCDFTKNGYRLPTEAEWEYAARAGTKDNLWGIPEPLDEYAYYNNMTNKAPFPVHKKKANAFGLYDMNGNVAEIVWDWYDETYYAKSPKENPTGPAMTAESEYKIVRGGYYENPKDQIKATSKKQIHLILREVYIGFRIAKNRNQ